MPYDPERHHRQSVRWRGHDYAAGGTYFVTICTAARASIFGDVIEAEMHVNRIGRIVEDEWVRTGVLRPEVSIDVFCLMPNHLHGLITIAPPDERRIDVDAVGRAHNGVPSSGKGRLARTAEPMSGGGAVPAGTPASTRAHSGVPLQQSPGQTPGPPVRATRSLSSIVAQFKATSTRVVNEARGTPGEPVWQRGFHEHVVRDDGAFNRIAHYIVTNPERWTPDETDW